MAEAPPARIHQRPKHNALAAAGRANQSHVGPREHEADRQALLGVQ